MPEQSGKTLAKARFDIDGQIALYTWVWKRKKPKNLTADSLGDVLNVHTEAFWMDTRGFSARHTTHATTTTHNTNQPNNNTNQYTQ